MQSGQVKWFNVEKRFGFIALDDAGEGGRDVFVHASAVEDGGVLNEGDRVEVEWAEAEKGPKATSVRVLA